MRTKICSKCHKRKLINKFPKRKTNSIDDYHTWCISCIKKYNKQYQKVNKEKINQQKRKYNQEHIKKLKEYQKNYYQDHKEKLIKYSKEYRQKNKAKFKKSMKEWYQKNKERLSTKAKKYYKTHKNEILKRTKSYYRKNKKKIIEYNVKYRKQRRKNNINIRLKDRLSKRIWDALKKSRKSVKTMKLIGCSVLEFKQYLEKQFKEGMAWNNWGTGWNGKGKQEWHIDHIKPCASFDLNKPKEQQKCFNYKNLQPLWAKDNWSKNDKGRLKCLKKKT